MKFGAHLLYHCRRPTRQASARGPNQDAAASGSRRRDEREARGWTQADLAARIGVSRKTVNTVENGVFVPSTVIALKMAEAFGLTVEKLFWIER